MQQVLDVLDSRDRTYVVFDASDQPLIFELPAQDDDPAVDVDADLSLGNRSVAEELALNLTNETDVVELWREVVTVSELVGEPYDLARLVMGVAIDSPGAASERGGCAVTSEVSATPAATWVEEELQNDAGGQAQRRNCSQPIVLSHAVRSGAAPFERRARPQQPGA